MDAAGAEAVKTMVKAIVDEQIQDIKMQNPGISIQMSGDYTVVPKDTYYALTTPHVVINFDLSAHRSEMETEHSFTIDYGSTNINIMPGAAPNQWRMAFALPSPIRLKMAPQLNHHSDSKKIKADAPSELKEIEIYQATKRAQILWDDIQKMALKTDMLIENIQIKHGGKTVPITFGSLASTTNAAETSPGIYTGTSNISVKDFSLDMSGDICPTPCKNPGTIKIGEFFGNGAYAGYDHKMYRTFEQKMSDMMDAGYDANKLPTPEAFSALWKDIMTYGFNTIDKADGTVGIRNISVSISEAPGSAPQDFSIKEVSYSGGIANWKADKATLSLGFGVDGMVLPPTMTNIPAFKIFASYIPSSAHKKTEITNLPHKKLFEQLGAMGQNFMASIGPAKCAPTEKPEQCAIKNNQASQQTQMLGLQAMMTMPQLFAEAGTKVTVHMDADAPKLTALVDGDFTANAAAIYSGIGKLKATMGGIDALIADIQTASKDPATSPADAKKFQNALSGLTAFQMFGQQGTDAKGNPARIFDMTLDEKGAVKLNGADLSTFSKMAAPAGPDQSPLPATGKP